MPQRIAAVMGLLVFTICLVIGGVQADNTFETTVWRALVAMGGTVVIGLAVGWMAQRMLDEHLKVEEKKLRNSSAKSVTVTRTPPDAIQRATAAPPPNQSEVEISACFTMRFALARPTCVCVLPMSKSRITI